MKSKTVHARNEGGGALCRVVKEVPAELATASLRIQANVLYGLLRLSRGVLRDVKLRTTEESAKVTCSICSAKLVRASRCSYYAERLAAGYTLKRHQTVDLYTYLGRAVPPVPGLEPLPSMTDAEAWAEYDRCVAWGKANRPHVEIVRGPLVWRGVAWVAWVAPDNSEFAEHALISAADARGEVYPPRPRAEPRPPLTFYNLCRELEALVGAAVLQATLAAVQHVDGPTRCAHLAAAIERVQGLDG